MQNDANNTYRVLLQGGEGEYIEKKSRFIGIVRKCETEAEATAFVEEMKKKYWDAR
ncbi:MAG: YigZ family protein, partial [Lachnospiraceae bacterium]|nr:YigZ family protein [Lachnospiraceae bacterium]